MSSCKAGINPNKSEQMQSEGLFMLPLPDLYKNSDELLLNIGAAKFNELDKSHNNPQTLEGLQDLTALYRPGYISPSFIMTSISVEYVNRVTLSYKNAATEKYAVFKWQRFILVENATKDFFRGDESVGYIEERNGITYAVKEYADETGERSSYEVGWAQHGQTFRGMLSPSFTLEEVLAFCNAQPIESWELIGDAVSVSIQGMGDVTIYDDVDNAIIIRDDILYNSNMERIGYRWLINVNTSRYQYVLEPREYVFHADNAINDEPDVLVKHFAAGECVAEVNYNQTPDGEPLTQFTLRVTPNPANSTLTP